jgi:hypothetical protein
LPFRILATTLKQVKGEQLLETYSVYPMRQERKLEKPEEPLAKCFGGITD